MHTYIHISIIDYLQDKRNFSNHRNLLFFFLFFSLLQFIKYSSKYEYFENIKSILFDIS